MLRAAAAETIPDGGGLELVDLENNPNGIQSANNEFQQENLLDSDDGGSLPKPRKQRPKLTTEMLRSDKGLTYLYTKGRHIKFQGRGFEREDLRKLMQFYRFWAKDVFLRLSFPAFVDRAIKLNKSKEMRAYLSGLKHREQFGDSGALLELSGETVEDASATQDGGFRVLAAAADVANNAHGDGGYDADMFGMDELNAAARQHSIQASLVTEAAVVRDNLAGAVTEAERIAQNRAAALARLAEKQRLRDLELQRMEEEADDLPEDPWRAFTAATEASTTLKMDETAVMDQAAITLTTCLDGDDGEERE